MDCLSHLVKITFICGKTSPDIFSTYNFSCILHYYPKTPPVQACITCAISHQRVVFVQHRMNESRVYQKCITNVIYRKKDHEQYSGNVKRPVLEDKGKYIALLQLVYKTDHECIMNQS